MDTQSKNLEVLNKELENRRGFPGDSVVKNLLINVGVAGLMPRSRRFPWRRKCSILAWEIPWTEEAGGLQFMGLQKSRT